MENPSPERVAASPPRVQNPPPTLNPESVIDLESPPPRDSNWPRPLNELEKERGKASAQPLPKPDPRPTPAAQALLNQEQQKKKKQKQQQQQQTSEKQQKHHQTSEKQQKQQQQRQTPGAPPPPQPTQVASGTTPTTSDKQVVVSKKAPATASAIRFGQALTKPGTSSSDKLETADQFIKAWNDSDLDRSFSTSTSPHPAGPSRMFQSLHSVETSVLEAKRIFEVTSPHLLFLYFDMIKLHYSQSPRFGSND